MKLVRTTCVRCGGPRELPSHRWCRACKAAYNRERRAAGLMAPLTPAQREHDRARSTARTAQARGELVPEPCERCGAPDVEKHHDDYSRPLAVRWLCRSCHLALHGCAEGGPGQPEGRGAGRARGSAERVASGGQPAPSETGEVGCGCARIHVVGVRAWERITQAGESPFGLRDADPPK